MRRTFVAAAAGLLLSGLFVATSHAASKHAQELAKKIIIADTHIDVPYRLEHHWEDISERTDKGEFDYVRAIAGGLDAPFMSIYTPSNLEKKGGSKALAEKLIDMVDSIATAHPDKFRVAVTPKEVENNHKKGIISFCMGMENGSPIEGDLANIKHFYDRGIRYITLTHAKDNHICDSSYDTTGTWKGLSPFGREVVAEMNRVGIMIDVSHISDNTFWQVMDLSEAPVLASHSSCRHFLPGFERNMDDDMIRRLGEANGVIQINFGSTFISQKSREWQEEFGKARSAYFKGREVGWEEPEMKAFMAGYRAANPFPRATVSDVADHFDHVVKLAGVDHVGFGSDFDGVGDSLPIGLMDVSFYPELIDELLKRGYSDDDIEKMAFKNVARVWRDVEKVAKKSK